MTRKAERPSSAAQAQRIWPWLPVFRVVAETQHLPTAAARLHVSASALSRTVHLIEDALGEPLFTRGARRITLNAAGRRLLVAVQQSAGVLERALPAVLGAVHLGEHRVSSLGVLTDLVVLPALLELAGAHPGLVPRLTTLGSREANRALVAGEVDVAFYYDATPHPGVDCRRIGALGNGVYCGAGHPLFGVTAARAAWLEHPFSVAAIGDRGTPMDGWPVELPRRIGFQILQLSTNVQVALSGRFLTVLPRVVADPLVHERRLWTLDTEVVPDTTVHAARRSEDAGVGLAETVIGVVEARLAEAARSAKEARLAEAARSSKEARLAEAARSSKEARLAEAARARSRAAPTGEAPEGGPRRGRSRRRNAPS